MMIEDYAVLRRGELTQREAAVCAYVWRCWVDARPAKVRGAMASAGYRSTSAALSCMRRLAQAGWLAQDPIIGGRNIASKGPRMAGLDHGWPLELAA